MKELATGTVVDGRYSIESPLGRGGFAAVYKAHHQRLNKAVAVKVLDLPDVPMDVQPFIQRFMREAQVSARIEHSNIVTVYDYGVIEGTSQPYIAMEFLNGHDLDEELKRNGALTIDRILRIFVPTLEALGVAHTNGVVHKDLKPSNLFLVRPGTPREKLVVLDFGIARFFTEEDSRLTQTGGFSGTPAYLAPEYIETQLVSPSLDVYQMGLILLEAMTSYPAVRADNSMAYMLAHCSGDISFPQGLLGSELGDVIVKATHRDPTQRYKDAHEFADALRKVNANGLAVTPTLNSPPADAAEMGTAETLAGPVTPSAVHMLPPETPLDDELGVPTTFKAVVFTLLIAIVGTGATAAYIFSQRELEPPVEEEPIIATVTETPVTHKVVVNARPQADVFVDDEFIGFTPITHEFKDGESVVVRVQAEGYKPEEKTIESSENLRVRLEKEPAKITEVTKPPDVKEPVRPKKAIKKKIRQVKNKIKPKEKVKETPKDTTPVKKPKTHSFVD